MRGYPGNVQEVVRSVVPAPAGPGESTSLPLTSPELRRPPLGRGDSFLPIRLPLPY